MSDQNSENPIKKICDTLTFVLRRSEQMENDLKLLTLEIKGLKTQNELLLQRFLEPRIGTLTVLRALANGPLITDDVNRKTLLDEVAKMEKTSEFEQSVIADVVKAITNLKGRQAGSRIDPPPV